MVIAPASPSYLAFLICVLAALVSLIFWPAAAVSFQAPKAATLAAGAGLLLFCLPREGAPVPRLLLGLLLLLFCQNLLSSLFAPSLLMALSGSEHRLDGLVVQGAYCLFFYMALRYRNWVNLRFYSRTMATALLLVGGYGLIQRAGLDPLPWDRSDPRIYASLGYSNLLAGWLVLVLPLAWDLRRSDAPADRLLGTSSSLIGLVAMVWTLSRGGWIALLVAVAFYCAPKRRIGIMLLIPFFFTASAWERLTSLASPGEKSVVQRLDIWKVSGRMALESPWLGCGFENLAICFAQRRPLSIVLRDGPWAVADKAHNEIFHRAATTGFLGLFFWLWLLIAALFFLRGGGADPRRRALLTSLVGYLIFWLFHFGSVATDFLFYLHLAFAVGCSPRLSSPSAAPAPSSPMLVAPLRRLGAGLMALYSLLLMVSHLWLFQAHALWKSKAYRESFRRVEAARRLFPLSIKATKLSFEVGLGFWLISPSADLEREVVRSQERALALAPDMGVFYSRIRFEMARHDLTRDPVAAERALKALRETLRRFPSLTTAKLDAADFVLRLPAPLRTKDRVQEALSWLEAPVGSWEAPRQEALRAELMKLAGEEG